MITPTGTKPSAGYKYMKEVLTPQQMQAADLYTQMEIGLASLVLMERAALFCMAEIKKMAGVHRVLCVCGRGNNGGDGIAIARLLHCAGYHAEVFFIGSAQSATASNAAQLKTYKALGGIICDTPCLNEADLIVDAMFGIGLSRDLEGEAAALTEQINAGNVPVLSVDIPSGIDGETGAVRGSAVMAEVTVTFQFLKRGLLLEPGRTHCGRLVCADIGIVRPQDLCVQAFCYDKEDLQSLLPPRRARSNKGSYGKLLIVAGKEGMAGAAVMCATAALRCGCGLVKVMSAPANRVILQTRLPEALYAPFPEGEDMGARLQEELAWADAVAIGPGLGTDETARSAVSAVLQYSRVPVLMDADALNVLAQQGIGEDTFHLRAADEKIPVIITPHPGEMGRLCKTSIADILHSLSKTALDFAKQHRVICVLKDAATVVSDGQALYINRSGCDGMATGGSCDVLSGVIAAFLAGGLDGMRAACTGVYLHGLAGEYAQAKLGARGMTAMDIAGALAPVQQK